MYHSNSNEGTIFGSIPLPLRFHASHSRRLHGNSLVPPSSLGGPMGDGVTSSSLPPCSRMNTHSLCYVALQDLPLQNIFMSHWCWIWLCDLYVSGILMNVTWAEVLNVLSWFVLASWTSFICHECLLVPAWETCGADLNGPRAWSRPTLVDLKTYNERQKRDIDIVSHWKLILFVYQNHCSKMWLILPWHAPS